MDRRKEWRAAERLLQQGNVDAALRELNKVADGAVADVVTLNRLGDLLARQGRNNEAIAYYKKIAVKFEQGGFAPKAIAIHKKILRLDANQLESAIQLGNLYTRQNMLGEARKYLLHAANRHLESGELPKAREVFEQLVEAEPDEMRHRVRLAETRAAEGDAASAVEQLLRVGGALLIGGEAGEAERIYARAHELQPRAEGPQVGLARCQEHGGRAGEAIETLETLVAEREASASALVELARLYAMAGRAADALRVAREAPFLDVPADCWYRLFSVTQAQGAADPLWEWLDRCAGDAARGPDQERVAAILSRLAELEEEGHLPALERLVRLLENGGHLRQHVSALDALARAYTARSMDDEAAEVRQRMRSVAPADEEPRAVASPGGSAGAIEHTSLVEDSKLDAARTALDSDDGETAPESPAVAEPPAVPLNRADEEFASGRVTQAEVLEKYNLIPQALAQLEEVLERFPGHIQAQEHRVELLRGVGSTPALAEALTELAVAMRTAGDVRGALVVANEAAEHPALTSASRRILQGLSLLTNEAPPAPAVEAAPPPPDATSQAPAAEDDGLGEIVIELDDAEAEPVEAALPTAAREPDADRLAGIRSALDAGEVSGAREQLDSLCAEGFAGPKLGALRRAIEAAAAEETVEQPLPAVAAGAAPEAAGSPPERIEDGAKPVDEDDDLSAIRAALEEELSLDQETPLVPEESPDQSVGEILKAFKERVDEEVGAEDHRTHYDLGIGFKEMGLLDEAIDAFEKAAGAASLHREASMMLAVCHRERGTPEQAVRWYRTAVEDAAEDEEVATGLRYDLAEMLLENGDREGALREFQDVQRSDPDFRNVKGRIGELELQLQS